jgi:hypothetical protein
VKNNYSKVLALLSTLGIKVRFTSDKTTTIYKPLKNNGSEIIYSSISPGIIFDIENRTAKYKEDICSFLLHEIGHFIVTPKQRRRREDYGIPETKNSVDDNYRFKYDLEELKAVMIENELKRLFGFKYAKNLAGGPNGNIYFYNNNKKLLMNWWESEGKLLAKTYAGLV